jgi:hypothetical protein
VSGSDTRNPVQVAPMERGSTNATQHHIHSVVRTPTATTTAENSSGSNP